MDEDDERTIKSDAPKGGPSDDEDYDSMEGSG